MGLLIVTAPLKGPPMARLLAGLAFLALPIVELFLLDRQLVLGPLLQRMLVKGWVSAAWKISN